MIHKFEQGGLYFVLDVDSGAIHMVDEVVYNVLDYYPTKSANETVSLFEGRFSEEDVLESIDDIDELIEEKLLFTRDFLVLPVMANRTVKSLCLNVAHDCNMKCVYCFASQGVYEGCRELMPLETGKAAFDFLVEQSVGRKNLEVDFFGGEPLLNFEVVKELVKYGRELEKKHDKNFRFTITTNGLLLDDEKIDFINKNMQNVVMSLDGRKQVNDYMRPFYNGEGTYEKIIPKFKNLIERRLSGGEYNQYFIRGTFTGINPDFFSDVKHMSDIGFVNLSVEPVVTAPTMPYALKREQLPIIYDQYEKLAEDMLEDRSYNFFHFNVDFNSGPCLVKRLTGCGAGIDYLAVTPSGEIFPCHQFVGNPDFVLGDVFNGIKDECKGIVNTLSKASALDKKECIECWAKFYCSGGCHANAYNVNGDILKPYELGCDMERKRIECAIYVYGKRMLEQDEDFAEMLDATTAANQARILC